MSATDQVVLKPEDKDQLPKKKNADLKDPLSGASKDPGLPAAFSMLEKTKMLKNTGCLSGVTYQEDRTGMGY